MLIEERHGGKEILAWIYEKIDTIPGVGDVGIEGRWCHGERCE
jgi:hypothetical protein